MKFTTAACLLFAGSVSAFAPLANTARTSSSLNAVLQSETGRSQLDPAVISRYNELPFPSYKILAEYVWVDAVGNTRSKTRTLAPSKVSLFGLSWG